MAAAGVGAPEGDCPMGECAPAGRASPAVDAGVQPTIDLTPDDAHDVIILAPVAATAHGLLVYLPTGSDAFGAPEPRHARNGRRAAAVDATAAWLPELDIAREAFFLAGELNVHDEGSASHQRRVTLVVAPTPHHPSAAEVVATPADRVRMQAAGRIGAWTTLAAAAAASPAATEGGAQYRIAAAAMAKVESYIRPTTEGPRFLRIGAVGPRAVNASSTAMPASNETMHARIARATLGNESLKRALRAVNAEEDADFHELCQGLADRIDAHSCDAIPDALRNVAIPDAPPNVTRQPYRHAAMVQGTDPAPKPQAPARPPDGWWPHDASDIIEDAVMAEIATWVRANQTWHASGGKGPRPAAKAWSAHRCMKPRARGFSWDLRGGPGNIRLWDDTMEPKRTKVNRTFAAELFAECADREIVDFCVDGICLKADLEPQIVLMPNLHSLYELNGTGAASAQVADMVANDWIGVFDTIPGCPLRVVSRGMTGKNGTEELRGIVDQGQPRKPLRTEGDGEEVEALNPKTKLADWSHEDKDTIENATYNGVIIDQLMRLQRDPAFTDEVMITAYEQFMSGEPLTAATEAAIEEAGNTTTFEHALDYSKYFHRLVYRGSELWQIGSLVPSPSDAEKLVWGLEYAVSMGASPSSQILQRFGNATNQAICRRFDARECERHKQLRPALRAELKAREALQPTCYGTMAKIYNGLQYTDDLKYQCGGANASVDLLRCTHEIVGPKGLNVPLSRAAKQQSGIAVTWLGACSAASLGLVWLPSAKATKASADIRRTLDGDITVGEYRKLTGFLVSIHFMVGSDATLLHHIFRPLKPGEEIDGGPATKVIVDPYMRATLERWQSLILNNPGTPAMATHAAGWPPTTDRPIIIRTDAALQGTPSPGLGAWLYGHWFDVPIAGTPGLEKLDIPHLELLAAGCGIVGFEHIISGAHTIVLESDALATVLAIGKRARSPAMQVILDVLFNQPAYKRVARHLRATHTFGEGNPMADAASRGYSETLKALSQALGVESIRLRLPEAAARFLREALDALEPLHADAQSIDSTAIGMHNPNMMGDHPFAHQGECHTPAHSPGSQPQPRTHAPPHTRPAPHPGRSAARVPSLARAAVAALAGWAAMPAALPSILTSAMRHHIGHSAHAVAPAPSSPPSPPGTPQSPPSQPLSMAAAAAAATTTAAATAPMWAPPSPPRASGAGATSAHTPPSAHSPAVRKIQRAAAPTAPAPRTPASPASPAYNPPPPPPPPESVAAAFGNASRASSARQAAQQGLAEATFQRLRNDTSEHAIGADDDVLMAMCEAAAYAGDDMPVTSSAQLDSNWKAWSGYCRYAGISPWRPTLENLDAVGAERERIIWGAALPYIHAHMQPAPGRYLPDEPGQPAKRPQPPYPASALAVLRGVRRIHLDKGIEVPGLRQATRHAHGLALKYRDLHGPEAMQPKRKASLTHRIICGLLCVEEGAPIMGRGKPWSWATDFGRSTRTLIHVEAQTGFRKAEVSLDPREKWGKKHIAFSNVTWRIGGEDYAAPSRALLRTLKAGDYAVIRPPPSKADQFGMRWGAYPIWLPYHPTAAINAARELACWEMHAGVAPEKRATTPLFCGPEGAGTPLKRSQLDDIFSRLLLAHLKDPDEVAKYSVHSFRSYLASAMMQAGCTDGQIQAALRWASDDALRLYRRTEADKYGGWLLGAERVNLTAAMTHHLPRAATHVGGDGEVAAMIGDLVLRAEAVRLTASRRRRAACRGR